EKRGEQAAVAKRKCAGLILALWEHRHALPNGHRPLEDFEPILATIGQLRSTGTWFQEVREIPRADNLPAAAHRWLTAARTLDRGCRALVRYCLAEAMEELPKARRRWERYVQAVGRSSAKDLRVIINLVSDAKDFASEEAKITAASVKEMKNLLDAVQQYERVCGQLRDNIRERVER